MVQRTLTTDFAAYVLMAVTLGGCASPAERSEVTLDESSTSQTVETDHHQFNGMHRANHNDSGPTLAGQYAFATIGEVVALLEADPDTDWSLVNLERLRQHLIDMERVTTDSIVEAEPIDGGARFLVRGSDPRTQASIRQMVSAHALTMASPVPDRHGQGGHETPWQYASSSIDRGMTLTVTASDERGARQIRALGFIGVMVRGDHHPSHHWALATGEDPHRHTH